MKTNIENSFCTFVKSDLLEHRYQHNINHHQIFNIIIPKIHIKKYSKFKITLMVAAYFSLFLKKKYIKYAINKKKLS